MSFLRDFDLGLQKSLQKTIFNLIVNKYFILVSNSQKRLIDLKCNTAQVYQ